MLSGNLQQWRENDILLQQLLLWNACHGKIQIQNMSFSCSKRKKIPIKFLYHTTINAIYVYTITINNMTFNDQNEYFLKGLLNSLIALTHI